MAIEVFKRVEQKYIISRKEYNNILKLSKDHLIKDKYFKSTNASIYFDTNNNDLIINSLEKPPYKEKFRVRSYGVPNIDSNVFFEVKKKYKGVVNKRRITIKLEDLYNYINGYDLLKGNKQISRELDYYFKYYNLAPSLYIAYDRLSYMDKDNHDFRVTFDTNVRSRDYDLYLEKGDYGKVYFKDKYIMEIKSIESIPLWFSHILSELKIYPSSYSKYGEIYKKRKEEMKNV